MSIKLCNGTFRIRTQRFFLVVPEKNVKTHQKHQNKIKKLLVMKLARWAKIITYLFSNGIMFAVYSVKRPLCDTGNVVVMMGGVVMGEEGGDDGQYEDYGGC
ncbi:hypothetical protein Tco_0315653 [Tanacetum coccineum]